jgi:hypothetical protein
MGISFSELITRAIPLIAALFADRGLSLKVTTDPPILINANFLFIGFHT